MASWRKWDRVSWRTEPACFDNADIWSGGQSHHSGWHPSRSRWSLETFFDEGHFSNTVGFLIMTCVSGSFILITRVTVYRLGIGLPTCTPVPGGAQSKICSQSARLSRHLSPCFQIRNSCQFLWPISPYPISPYIRFVTHVSFCGRSSNKALVWIRAPRLGGVLSSSLSFTLVSQIRLSRFIAWSGRSITNRRYCIVLIIRYEVTPWLPLVGVDVKQSSGNGTGCSMQLNL